MESEEATDILPELRERKQKVRYLTKRRFKKPKSLVATVKKFHVNLKPTKKSNKWLKQCLLWFSVVFLCVAYYSIPKCCDIILTKNIKAHLLEKIVGQQNAIDKVVNNFNSEKDFKLTVVVGSTGVGKTLTFNTVLEFYRNASNIIYTNPSTLFKDVRYSKLVLTSLFCMQTIIIVDGLTVNHLSEIEYLRDLLKRREHFLNKLHVILIINSSDNINVQTMDALLDTFKTGTTEKTIIEFERLNEENLIDCIKLNLKLYSKEKFDARDLLKYFDVAQDGCKGVSSKVRGLDRF